LLKQGEYVKVQLNKIIFAAILLATLAIGLVAGHSIKGQPSNASENPAVNSEIAALNAKIEELNAEIKSLNATIEDMSDDSFGEMMMSPGKEKLPDKLNWTKGDAF
jgi:cell division protein FtsB